MADTKGAIRIRIHFHIDSVQDLVPDQNFTWFQWHWWGSPKMFHLFNFSL